ncbi:hypothetical protein TEA_022558 [Camellia sinensis var. sinensis]|uniref:proline--tRNA ligase n=1 Tax=Camellia sinensis var. sinensis TaxID=542762 RepID=A0A4S4F0D0_CAMSN|nr:hypothetical protein TEA_022558 [Camellia sinensis var. sinensis]
MDQKPIGHQLYQSLELSVLTVQGICPVVHLFQPKAVVLEILELYRCIYEEYLAIPVIKGKKSEHEKFAGGLYTTSVEAFIPNTGRGIQGATSHCLGQNFAKMFEINFENEKGEKTMVWQNSWAYSTRTILTLICGALYFCWTIFLGVMDFNRCIYEEYLAIPVIKGKKSEHEKFAGGLYTTSVEAFIPNTGRGIQGATSHCLGQNFAKMFEINFENEKGEKTMVWQNSWAYSTRTYVYCIIYCIFLAKLRMMWSQAKNWRLTREMSIQIEVGVMVMVHGDNKGLVLPPKVAAIQVIVIPVPYKDADTKGIFDACDATVKTLTESGFRAEADFRDNYSPGWKYSHWEMKGVPLRIEIGPKDLSNNQVRAVRRDNSTKIDIPMASLVEQVKDMLANIHQSLFDVAKQKRDTCIQVAKTWDEFMEALSHKKMILAPWCDEEEVEKDVKARTKGEMGAAKTLCSPFDQPALDEGVLCFASGKPAKKWTYWGRSY